MRAETLGFGPERKSRVSLGSVMGSWERMAEACQDGIITQRDLREGVRGGLVDLIRDDLRNY